MGRNSSGTYSLPSPGVPFQSGQTISSAQVNTALTDIASALTDSASRTGSGNFTAPVRAANGTVAAPSFAYTAEPGSGQYLAAAGDLRLAVAGVDALKLASGGLGGDLKFAQAGDATVSTTATNAALTIKGNRAAATVDADVFIATTATRTAGWIAAFLNVTSRLLVDWQGLLTLGSQAAAIQPPGIWTAITPDAGITAVGGLGFSKDALGFVHLRGSVANGTGGATSNVVTTNPLPAGFRPTGVQRTFTCATNSGAGTMLPVSISPAGAITIPFTSSLANGVSMFLDSISFIAEQ